MRRDGDRTISGLAMERASRQRSADRLHGRPARQCDPRRHLFWTKDKVRMMPVGPLELRLPGIQYPRVFKRRCCHRAMNSPTKRPNKPNGIQEIRVHAFHTHGANARLKGGNRWLANQICRLDISISLLALRINDAGSPRFGVVK
jgi:hypothetical protein